MQYAKYNDTKVDMMHQIVDNVNLSLGPVDDSSSSPITRRAYLEKAWGTANLLVLYDVSVNIFCFKFTELSIGMTTRR